MGIGRVGSAPASLEDAEVGLVHVRVLIEVGGFATVGRRAQMRPGGTLLEQVEIVLIHLPAAIEVGWTTASQPKR